MIPVITARMPRAIRDVLSDLNMTVPFAWFAAPRSGGVRIRSGQLLTAS
jgi:hypothetical protein